MLAPRDTAPAGKSGAPQTTLQRRPVPWRPLSKHITPVSVSRPKENGFHERPPISLEPAAKRICTISPAPRHSPAHTLPISTQLHPTPPPLQHYALDDIAAPHILHREHSQRMLEIRELKDRPRLPGMWVMTFWGTGGTSVMF